MRKSKFVAFFAGLAVCGLLWAQDAGMDAAKQLFARYLTLEEAYDPAIADLYADQALIKSRRSYPMGEPRDTIIAAPTYKAQLRELMAAAKVRGDRHTYSEVSYVPEGQFVRITASRFFASNKRTSPISLLVGRTPGGKWLIYEELSESQQ